MVLHAMRTYCTGTYVSLRKADACGAFLPQIQSILQFVDSMKTSTEKTRKRASRIPSSSFKLRTLRPERLSIVGQEVLDLSGKTSAVVPTPAAMYI
jgi:hypothetical protein